VKKEMLPTPLVGLARMHIPQVHLPIRLCGFDRPIAECLDYPFFAFALSVEARRLKLSAMYGSNWDAQQEYQKSQIDWPRDRSFQLMQQCMLVQLQPWV